MRKLIPAVLVAGCTAGAVLLAASGPQEVLVGSYSTTIQGRTDAQAHNAELALKEIDGVVIAPQETFSFNKVVGTWSRDAGYRRAPVSYNGTLIDSWGGGVCQTSTTLYNAGMLAGLELIERSPHRFAPSYAPPGRDSAVAYGDIDLRMRNPYAFPIRIKGYLEGNRLIVQIYGKRAPAEKPVIASDLVDVRPSGTYLLTGKGSSGRVRNNGKAGYEVRTYRIWSDRKELLSSDSYPAMHKIIEYR